MFKPRANPALSAVHLRNAVSILFFFFLTPCVSRAGQNVRIGIYQNSPKVAMSESGHPEGIFVDIIQVIAEEEGWSLKYVPGTWTKCLERLKAGEIDLMPDVAYSEQRGEIFAFHNEPVLSDWFQIYARRGSGIHSLLDLTGKRVGVLEDSVQEEAFEKIYGGFDPHIILIPLQDYSEMFGILKKGPLPH